MLIAQLVTFFQCELIEWQGEDLDVASGTYLFDTNSIPYTYSLNGHSFGDIINE